MINASAVYSAKARFFLERKLLEPFTENLHTAHALSLLKLLDWNHAMHAEAPHSVRHPAFMTVQTSLQGWWVQHLSLTCQALWHRRLPFLEKWHEDTICHALNRGMPLNGCSLCVEVDGYLKRQVAMTKEWMGFSCFPDFLKRKQQQVLPYDSLFSENIKKILKKTYCFDLDIVSATRSIQVHLEKPSVTSKSETCILFGIITDWNISSFYFL